MALMEWTVVHLPVGEGWTGQPAYERVFGSGWRIILASMTAFFVGDFLNSVVLAKMKIWTTASTSGPGRSAAPWSARARTA